eukprot:CAMPEP_0197074372 /NCGR_PEP_ID=MMETSP1384-20130603/211077_1 /TAXON_ID=29189 /ORGANISM="Ammonia sp." /LENGTH=432 /DNA_ID=CAMNT_0042513213 /DNA_START=27 /DNA_END=1322 /DNA_ORIENTATION=+
MTRIRYDQDAALRVKQEWINAKQDGSRIAALHTHTKNHQTHQQLKSVSEQRKKEWSSSHSLSLTFPRSANHGCSYHQRCQEMVRRFVHIHQINDAMFEYKGDRCFCVRCHRQRQDKELYSRGKPSQSYVLPVGYARFGIKLPKNERKENILQDWHVVYHGTKAEYLKEISESGLILLKPNDFRLGANKSGKNKLVQIRCGHIPSKFIRINDYTKQSEEFDPIQIFTSPSCVYASKYCDRKMIDGDYVSFMFQCRQKPGSYQRGQETMGYGACKIDKFISNESIEFYTKSNLDIIITGILVKIHGYQFEDNDQKTKEEEDDDFDEDEHFAPAACRFCEGTGRFKVGMCFRCKGKGKCLKCDGSGTWTNKLKCNACAATGTIDLARNAGSAEAVGYTGPITINVASAKGAENVPNVTEPVTLNVLACIVTAPDT